MGHDPVVLVTGAAGQVGTALKGILPKARYLDRAQLDVTDPTAVIDAVAGTDVIVHLAAVTTVDGCEREPDAAWAINGQGTANVVEAARAWPTRVIYLSTDYVFDGTKEEYSEEDMPSPLNRYGASKLEGERHVLGLGARGLVVRTSWLMGSGPNFVRTILDRARAGQDLHVVYDQVGRPTFADPLASALVHLVHVWTHGILHVAGDGVTCSWADLADAALAAAGLDTTVQRITTAEYFASATRPIAPRPARSVLALGKARALGVPLLDWRQSLPTYVETLT